MLICLHTHILLFKIVTNSRAGKDNQQKNKNGSGSYNNINCNGSAAQKEKQI